MAKKKGKKVETPKKKQASSQGKKKILAKKASVADKFRERVRNSENKPKPDNRTVPNPKNPSDMSKIYWDPERTEVFEDRTWRSGNYQYRARVSILCDGTQQKVVWTGWELFVRQVNPNKYCIIFTQCGKLLRWQLQMYSKFTERRRPLETGGWTNWERQGQPLMIGPHWIWLEPMPIRNSSTEQNKGCFNTWEKAMHALNRIRKRYGVPLGEIEGGEE